MYSVSQGLLFTKCIFQRLRNALVRENWAEAKEVLSDGDHTVGVAAAAQELFLVTSQLSNHEAEHVLVNALSQGQLKAPHGGLGNLSTSQIELGVSKSMSSVLVHRFQNQCTNVWFL